MQRLPTLMILTTGETRALAKRVSFDTAKKRLLELAKDYDRIAVRKHERREKMQE
jgi:hypothetical protein